MNRRTSKVEDEKRPLNYKEQLKAQLLAVQKQAAEGKVDFNTQLEKTLGKTIMH